MITQLREGEGGGWNFKEGQEEGGGGTQGRGTTRREEGHEEGERSWVDAGKARVRGITLASTAL